MGGLPSRMWRSMMWRLTMGSFLATSERGVNFFLRIQFQEEQFSVKMGTHSGRRKMLVNLFYGIVWNSFRFCTDSEKIN